jgi:pilus assembly protein CpaC
MKKNIFYILIFSLIFTVGFSIDSFSKKRRVKSRKTKIKYRDVNAVVGIRKEIYFDFDVSKTHVTDSSVFKLELQDKDPAKKIAKDRVVIYALKEGKTDLWVYDDKNVLRTVYAVSTTQDNLKRIHGFLKEELGRVEGLKMYIREDKIVLDGEILIPEDMARIHQVITAYPDVFHIQYKMSPMLYKITAEKMEKEIGISTVQVKIINNKFVLEGEVKDNETFNYVRMKAALLLPKYYYYPSIDVPAGSSGKPGSLQPGSVNIQQMPIIYKFLKVLEPVEAIPKVIKISMYFVEIVKGFEKDFNFTFAPGIDTSSSNLTLSASNQSTSTEDSDGNTTTTAEGLGYTLTGTINNFIPKLKSILEHKRGRVIQSAAVSVENEQTATVKKETQYPYPVITNNTVSTETFNVGLNIKVTPKILGDPSAAKDIALTTDVGVSQVTSISDNGTPVIAKNSVGTVVNIKSGETAAIGGVVQNISSKSYGDKPSGQEDTNNVIINLSRSKAFQKNKTQFVIFITPEILESATKGSEKAKKQFRVK